MEAAEEAAAEAVASSRRSPRAEAVEFAAAEGPVETSEDVDVIPSDAAEPVEASERWRRRRELRRHPNLSKREAGEPMVEEEGPEPARIPTSLTATLREQGPRYLHRVSRRMRRRGRDGRDGHRADVRSRGPRPESGRGPQREPRPHEPGPRNVPEHRTAPAPPVKEAAAARPEKSRSALHQRSAAGGAGDHRSDRQGAAGAEGRAHHIAHRAAGAFPGLHADGGPHRRVAKDSERRRTHAPEARAAIQSHRHSGRIHRADGGRGPRRKKSCAPT